MVQESSGEWGPHEAGVSAVISELLPSDLRDFFVMDADEAADYVGGSENKVVQRQDVIGKTSFAVRALLGLDVFKEATERIQRIAEGFGRAATKAIGDDELTRQQQELDRCRKDRDRYSNSVENDRKKSNEIEDGLIRAKDKLEGMVGNIATLDELANRLKDNRTNKEKFAELRKEKVEKLSSQLSSIDLTASLATNSISNVRTTLQPMYDDGSIPSRHISFVKGLIERGECVCGQRLDVDNEFKRRVSNLVEESQGKEGLADYLAEVLQASNSLSLFDNGSHWETKCQEIEREIAELDIHIGKLDQESREIDNKLNEIDHEEVHNTRNEIDMYEKQRDTLNLSKVRNLDDLERCKRRVNELEGKVHAQQKRERKARDDRTSQQVASILVEILNQAYGTIRDAQVQELDNEMNRLFFMMAANVNDDEDVVEGDRRKASLRMIEQVGLQPLTEDTDDFEIYAFNRRRRFMPPTEINGASRRILALSFVLALCNVSKTYAPLVADSLLNFLSGSVRTNCLRVNC